MENLGVPLPKWLETVDKTSYEHERVKSLLRLAAIHATREGSLRALGRLLNYHEQSFIHWAARPTGVPSRACLDIERICGRELFPRELINPRLYPPIK